MKETILAILVCFGLQAQSQITLCDSNMTYTSGSQFQLEVAFPTTGNSLPWMAPIYAWTYADTIILGEDSCFSGPCNHFIYNCCSPNGMPFDTITTCVSYEYVSSIVDTLTCCFSQYWDGTSWQRSATMTVNIDEYSIIKTNDNKMYDLNGRQILKPQGLYIKNGRLYYEQ